MPNHQDIDQRSLVFARRIAERVRERPELIDRARATVLRWMSDCSPRARDSLKEWQTALEGPLDDVLAVLTGDDERAVRLRQSNPFAGVLPRHERDAIIRQFHSHDPQAA